jgi:hypothetical protein
MISREDIEAFVEDQTWGYWVEEVREQMMTPLEMVRMFSEASGQNPDPRLYYNLIKEEYREFTDAAFCDEDPEELKELADLVYVIYGYAHSKGWDLDEALLRVHTNNVGRMYQPDGTIKRREDGKIIKNPDYPKVNLEDLV